MARRYKLTDTDRQVMEAASKLGTGGMATFTAHYFSPIHGIPRWDLVWKDQAAAKNASILSPEWNDRYSPEEWGDLGFKPEENEFIPWIPLGWQTAVAHDERLDTTIIAGFGCFDLDTYIYEADLQQYVTARWLIQNQHAPTVLSKTPEGWARARATVPYLKKTAEGYLVMTDSEKRAIVSGDHAFLTTRGYVRTHDLLPGDELIVPDRLPAIVRGETADGSHCLGTASSCRGDCLSHLHQRGGLSRGASTNDQSFSPSQAGAPSPTRCFSHSPCNQRGRALQHNRPGCDNCPRTKLGSIPLWVLHAEPGVPRRWHEAKCGQPLVELASRGQLLCEDKTSPDWQDVLESERSDLSPRASFYGASGHIVWSYRVGELDSTRTCGGLLATLRLLRASHARQRVLGVSSQLASSKSDAWSSDVPPNSDFWNCTTTEVVVKVQAVGTRDFYDIHVPIYGNYVAEGLVQHNSGKTVGLGAVLCYWCCQIPRFRAMNLAPVGWQAKQMYDAIRQDLVDYDNREERPTHISRMVTKMVERPYPKITWYNGSTIEFMSADEQGRKILSWSGDAAVLDEAGKLNEVAHTDLNELLVNLGSRMRGQVGGRQRMGKLIIMSTADFDPELWERFDLGKELPEYYLSLLVTTYDNPYNTKAQVDAIERRIRDPEKRRQLMLSERPLPKGKEFNRELLALAQCEALDDVMRTSRENELPGYEMAEMRGAGIVKWVTPPSAFDTYILMGDPGQNTPPNRNSAVVLVFKVTGFPDVPAELAAFNWIDGRGSYWPFINQMEEWYRAYHPIYAGFDATGVQKGFDELVFAQRGLLMEGISMQRRKMQMVVALKLIIGRGLLLMPKQVQGIWMQLAGWRMPDTKLRQDIPSCLFMIADAMNRLFVIDPRRADETEWVPTGRAGRLHRQPNPRPHRGNPGRHR